MIKFIIRRNNEADYNNYIGFSLKKLPLVQTCDIYPDNKDREKGYPAIWNRGIEAFLTNKISDEDIICLVHEDVSILDPNFAQKLEMSFKLKPEIGVFGIAGSTILPESLKWYEENHSQIRGQWLQNYNNDSILMSKENVGFFDDTVVLHKFFLAIRVGLLKEGLRFDECFTFDLYNVDFCLQVLERGYKLGVIDIFLKHNSDREGLNGKDFLISKYKEKGYNFPLSLDQFTNLNEIQGVDISL